MKKEIADRKKYKIIARSNLMLKYLFLISLLAWSFHNANAFPVDKE